jgi:hypothetical protein
MMVYVVGANTSSHMLTEETETNWKGILVVLKLKA